MKWKAPTEPGRGPVVFEKNNRLEALHFSKCMTKSVKNHNLVLETETTGESGWVLYENEPPAALRYEARGQGQLD